ncbi:MAG: MBL fold metallo-hydrolase [Anaerolineaceae bacterium]|nr:MBL fold metallo-hydrolase [Anaerolineaceae bacterium]
MRRLRPEIVMIQAGLSGRQYLILEDHSLTLIDTGLRGSGRLILCAIRRLGYQPELLKRILITHADPDHSGAITELKAASPAVVYASALARSSIASGSLPRPLHPRGLERIPFQWLLPLIKPKPQTMDFPLENDQVLPILGGLRVLATPGHTPDHLSFYLPREQVLFSGDSIGIRGRRLFSYHNLTTWNQSLADASFQRQMELNPRIICAGHRVYIA